MDSNNKNNKKSNWITYISDEYQPGIFQKIGQGIIENDRNNLKKEVEKKQKDTEENLEKLKKLVENLHKDKEEYDKILNYLKEG